jgi:hypothetical protein
MKSRILAILILVAVTGVAAVDILNNTAGLHIGTRAFGRSTVEYRKLIFMSNIGPNTRKASLVEAAKSVSAAMMKASVVLQRLSTNAATMSTGAASQWFAARL